MIFYCYKINSWSKGRVGRLPNSIGLFRINASSYNTLSMGYPKNFRTASFANALAQTG